MAGLTLLHLSDIHFKVERTGTQFDLDHEVRAALEDDLSRVYDIVGPINAVLVTGDVAFAGKPEEYDIARSWLATICARFGCAPEQVYVIPGNHDVDLAKTQKAGIVWRCHEALRKCDQREINHTLEQLLLDSDGEILFRPFEAYNAFASTFSCGSSADALAWNATLPLNADTDLALVGINSALISDRTESEDIRGLIISEYQHVVARNPKNVYAFLCHHPPAWLRDADAFEDVLQHRSTLQLFGHKHRARRTPIGNSLRLSAGAVHPSRREPDWQPCYNVLHLEEITEPARRLPHSGKST